MKHFLLNIKNNIDFFMRQHFNFSRKNYSEQNEPKDEISGEEFLLEKFDLDSLKSNSTKQNYLENLYTLDLLDKYLDVNYQENLSVLDIGCKNWFYAKGEHAFFKKYCKNLFLDGIEIDGNRLYSNFYSRAEVAKFHIKNLNGTNYIQKNFLNHNKKYDYIIWILPFIIEEPLLKWGLPKNFFQPEEMLLHAYNSLNPDGKIFIINQGIIEYELQKSLCEKLNLPYKLLEEIKSSFLSYKHKRYGILIED